MNVVAAILAGGLGTRLRPVVADRPKVLATVAGRAFVCHLLDRLVEGGLTDVVLLTGHRAEQVHDELGDSYRGLRLHHSHERSPLGTAGAVRAALPYLASDHVLLLNGDSFVDLDLAAFHRLHRERSGSATLTLVSEPDTSRYGRVVLGVSGRVIRFEEKAASAGPGWINAGAYLLSRQMIASLPAEMPLSLERDVLPEWVARGQVYGYRHGGRFLDIGTPESFARAEEFLSGVLAG